MFNFTVDLRDNRTSASSGVRYDILLVANGSSVSEAYTVGFNSSTTPLTSGNGSGSAARRPTSRQIALQQQQAAAEPVYRYRHHGHSQLPIEQHPPSLSSPASSSVSVSYRMQSAAGVGVVASVFFCATLFATLALGVFCRKRNTVFALQKTEQIDYSSAAAVDEGGEVEWIDSELDEDDETSTRRSITTETIIGRHGNDDDGGSSSDCETSLCGVPHTTTAETRFDRSVEWQRQRNINRKQRPQRATPVADRDGGVDQRATGSRRAKKSTISATTKASRSTTMTSSRVGAKRPETLALQHALTTVVDNDNYEDDDDDENDDDDDGNGDADVDSDTTSFYFRSESGDVSSPADNDSARRSMSSSNYRRSVSVSASLADDSAAFVDVGSQAQYFRYKSQPTTPRNDVIASDLRGGDDERTRRAGGRAPVEMQRQSVVAEVTSQNQPSRMIASGRIELAQCCSVVTLEDAIRDC